MLRCRWGGLGARVGVLVGWIRPDGDNIWRWMEVDRKRASSLFKESARLRSIHAIKDTESPFLAGQATNGAVAACRAVAFRASFPAFVALAVFFELS